MKSTIELRHQVFSELLKYFPHEDLSNMKRCALKLQNIFPNRAIGQNQVLVAYGGGKDSSYMVAFVRMMQLFLFVEYGDTFQLRVATNRHAGMPSAVMENIDRVYYALKLYQDPHVELLLIDGNEVNLFDLYRPLPRVVKERNRQDILISGHLTEANSRPTFCNACNISMVNSFGVAASYSDGVDVIITGDSLKEQRAYTVWVSRLAQKVGSFYSPGGGFKGFLDTMAGLSQTYFQEIYGESATDEIEARKIVSNNLRREPSFFSIYDYTNYSAGKHWELLTEYLQFEFDDLAFSFSESDCANPTLMAHLRGLKCERVYGRTYAEGTAEYVQFGIHLMQKKEFPNVLRK